MAGFGGAVEDGARSLGTVISLMAAVVVGWLAGSWGWGLVVFVVGYGLSVVWGHLAGESFRARQLEDRDPPPDPAPSNPPV